MLSNSDFMQILPLKLKINRMYKHVMRSFESGETKMHNKKCSGELLTRNQMMEYLQLSSTGFWRAQKAGQLPPAIYIGARRRWNSETVKKWLIERENNVF